MKRELIVGSVVIAVGLAAVSLSRLKRPGSVENTGSPPEQAAPANTAITTERSSPASTGVVEQTAAVKETVRPAAAQPETPPPPARVLPPTALKAQGMIGSVVNSISPDAVSSPAAIRQTIEALRAQGESAVPAIREFLEKALDYGFGPADQQLEIGYPSLRAALFGVLAQVGGDEARQVLASSLGQTADPREIGLLAGYLEKLAPGVHRQEIVASARETLELARRGQVKADDVGPLFDVLRAYGDKDVIIDLQRASSTWGHYATMALAGTPEGIAVVLQQANEASPRKPVSYLFSFEVLAQSAARFPEAGAGLVELAQEGKIPDQAWPLIANGLRSAEYYSFGKPHPARPPVKNSITGWRTGKVSASGEYYYSPPLSADQADLIQQRLSLADSLLAATSNPAAAEALMAVRTQLAGTPQVP